MKKMTPLFAIAVIALSCSNQQPKTAETTMPVAPAPVLPYTASYSSSFEMGKADYVATILQGEWKAWEENKIENMRNILADTVVAVFADNTVINGADSLVAAIKKYRALFSDVKDTINATMPVYSTDKKQNWVLVWATENLTKKDGSKEVVSWMETWRFNKDGKADMLLQCMRKKS